MKIHLLVSRRSGRSDPDGSSDPMGGVASLLVLVIALGLSALLVSAYSFLLRRENVLVRDTKSAQTAFAVAESGADEIINRLRKGESPPSPLTLPVSGGTATVTITANGGQRTIVSTGAFGGVTRTVEVIANLSTTTADFFYGAQVGEGGMTMGENADVTGNIYSDGNITGSTGNDISGDAIVAIGVAPTADQSWTVQNADYNAGTSVSSVVAVVDSGGDVGDYASLALGSDGFARISYYDATTANKDLKFVRCLDADCTAKNPTIVDSGGNVGSHTSIAIGSDQYARISYYDADNKDLKFVRCINEDCTTNSITAIDTDNDTGQFSSLVLDSNNLARISYYDVWAGDLNFIRCTNDYCTTRVTTSVDTSGDVGKYTSIVLDSNQLALISYVKADGDDLKFVRCTDADCATPIIKSVDTAAKVDYPTSIALGSDGKARIAYYDSTPDELKFALCADADCTTNTKTVVDSDGSVGKYASIKMAGGNLARISYYDDSGGSVKFAQCTNNDCTSKNFGVPDDTGNVGLYTSLVLGSDGFGRIAYRDDSNKDLKFIRCVESTCASLISQVDVAQGFQPSATQRAVKAELYIKKIGSPANATLRLIKDSGGSPSSSGGDVLATGNIVASQVAGAYGWLTVSFTSTPTLNANTTYWLVLDTVLNNSNYYIWGGDSAAGYSRGTAKRSADWSQGNWGALNADLDFKVFMGGVDYQISNVTVGGSVKANTMSNVTVGGNADGFIFNTGTVGGNLNADSIVSCTVGGNAYYNSRTSCTVDGNSVTPNTPPPDPPHVALPISEATITQWKTDAAAGGTCAQPTCDSSGNYDPSGCQISLGPMKVTGNLTLNNNCQGGQTLTVNGTIWVVGNIDISNNAKIILGPSYGSNSGVIIADGWVHVQNNGQFSGSGDPSSYLMMLSTLACDGDDVPVPCSGHHDGAIDLHNNATGAIFYAANGLINLHNGVVVTEIVAYKLNLDNNANLIYQSGLASASFTSGPTAGWTVTSWKELAQ